MKTLVLLSMLCMGGAVWSQDWSTNTYKYGEQYEGYVITDEGERVDGYIKYRNRMIMQEEVIFYSVKDNPSTKKKYMADKLSEYKVGDKLYHCIPYSGSSARATRANLCTRCRRMY